MSKRRQETETQKLRREFLETLSGSRLINPHNRTGNALPKPRGKAAKLREAVSASARQPVDPLATTTYGVEVERYNLQISDAKQRNVFVADIQHAAREEQKQKTRKDLGLRQTSPTTAALCVVRNLEGQVIMEVRLDGEKEIATSKDPSKVGDVCFNMEFISVGAGIKKHEEFFEDVAKGKESEINRVVTGFEDAVNSASPSAESDNAPSVVSSKVGGYTYEFTSLAQAHLIGKTLGPRVEPSGEEHEEEKETAFHVTHSMPLTDMDETATDENRAYIRKLGDAFEVAKNQGGDNEALSRQPKQPETPRGVTAAKTVFRGAPEGPVKNFTGERNRSQPLLKEPLEYLVVADNWHLLQRAYLEAVERGAVLQPSSNLLEYVNHDLRVYTELKVELEDQNKKLETEKTELSTVDEITRLTSARRIAGESKQLEEGINKLYRTVKGLSQISQQVIEQQLSESHTTSVEAGLEEKKEQLRLFESHDEKLQMVINDGYRRGLIELRSKHPLKEVIKHHVFPETAPENSEEVDVRVNAALDTKKNIARGQQYLGHISEAVTIVMPVVSQGSAMRTSESRQDNTEARKGSKEVKKWYGPEVMLPILERTHPGKVLMARKAEDIQEISETIHGGKDGEYVIPLNVNVASSTFKDGENNHWVGLKITKTGADIKVEYVDPTGRKINPEIEKQLNTLFECKVEDHQIKLQNGSCVKQTQEGAIGSVDVWDGNQSDCGAFVVHMLQELSRGPAGIKKLKDEAVSISLEKSEKLGSRLRQEHSQYEREEGTPSNESAIDASTEHSNPEQQLVRRESREPKAPRRAITKSQELRMQMQESKRKQQDAFEKRRKDKSEDHQTAIVSTVPRREEAIKKGDGMKLTMQAQQRAKSPSTSSAPRSPSSARSISSSRSK